MVAPTARVRRQLGELLRDAEVRSVYQPIVELDSGSIVAYEALARGPVGHCLERPDDLFAAARAAGIVGELDQECTTAALRGAAAASLTAPWTLFVNVEPEFADLALRDTIVDAAASMQMVVELTERKLTANPVELLRLVERVRARGWGIALDDVGADRNSLALLPLLRPDVIKLDLRLVQERATRDVAEIFSAVNAEAERSATTVLAEGIETQEHLDVALALGARLGQGWLLGRPAPLPEHLPEFTTTPIFIARRSSRALDETPFDIAARAIAPRFARKSLLVEISKLLEAEATAVGDAAVVIAALQHAQFFTPATKRRYQRLTGTAAFAAILGEDIPSKPLPGLRGGRINPGDPLLGEWDIAVLGPHFAACLVARDLGCTGADADRQFEFVLSHNREVVVAVAVALMARIDAEDSEDPE